MRKYRIFQAITLALTLSGCVLPDEEQHPETADTTSHLAGEGVLWPGGIVRVCWETQLAADGSGQSVDPRTRSDWSTLSRVVRDTMRSTWGRAANLDFTGFGPCPSNSATGNAGYLAINMAGGVNATGASTDIGYYSNQWTRMRLDPEKYGGAHTEKFRGQVMHETGHALGFHHEWDRADNPHDTGCTVADRNYTASTDTYYGTDFDKHSIMNFSYDQGDPSCALPEPYRLSAWDIVGVQNAYGRRKPGTLVAASGNCLDLPIPHRAGDGLQVWECHGGSNQVWRAGTHGTISAPSYSSSVMTASSLHEGSRLTASAHTLPLSSIQVFRASPNGFQLRGIGDTCLDVPGGSIYNGQRPQIYPCHGGTNQRWRAHADGTIRPAGNTYYCLDIPYGSAYAGNRVQLYACHGGSSQKFTFTDDGEIRFGSLCVDVIGGKPNAGSRLQLYTCKGAGDYTRVNQLWHLTLGLQSAASGHCVEAQNSRAANGTPVVQNVCNATRPGQTWDYYPSGFHGF